MNRDNTGNETHGLSFPSEFYLEGDVLDVKRSARPTSVYQAIISMTDDAWRRLAEDVIECDPEWLDPIDVVAKVGETNTCNTRDSAVEVWIDKAGRHVLRIYDGAKEERFCQA